MSLAHLVPHAPPMFWVDEVVVHDEASIHARSRVQAGRPFTTAAGWPAWVGMELIAQAAAVHRGLNTPQHEAGAGYLVGVPTLTVRAEMAPVGALLDVFVEVLWGDDTGLKTLQGRVMWGDTVWAEGRVQVYVTEEEA